MFNDVKNINSIDSPALIVFPAIVESNIKEMVRMVGDVNRLRPHIKTHKTAEGIRMMQGHGINKFKCATIAEAELLGMNNATDVILAHQPVGPRIERLYQVATLYPTTNFSCITDNIDSAKKINDVFEKHESVIGIYIDLNIGMNRTGISPNDAVIELHEAIGEMKSLNFRGMHVYDGHQRHPDPIKKSLACENSFNQVLELKKKFDEKAYKFGTIVAGGSPSFSYHATKNDRECSPGTNIFWDHGYAGICPEQHFKPAVYILTRVISVLSDKKICVDLGHKSVAAENDISKRVYFPEYPNAKAISQSEEHLVLEFQEEHTLKTGDMLCGIPYHICPTVALHEYLTEVVNDEITGAWHVTARRRKINC